MVLLKKCNEDNRDLMVYYDEEVEPAFLELIHINEEARHFYDEVFMDVMEYCDRVASEQNSFLWFIYSYHGFIRNIGYGTN